MKIDSLRILVLCWFILGIFTLIGHIGWKDWPPEAIAYAQWVEYVINLNPLPFQYQAYFPSLVISIIGMLLIFLRNSYGKFILPIGLALHFYSAQSSIPTIASNIELTLNSIFYLLTGVVWGISFTNRQTSSSSDDTKQR